MCSRNLIAPGNAAQKSTPKSPVMDRPAMRIIECVYRKAAMNRRAAMTLAMNDAGIMPSQVDYVNLHGTSTVLNDRIETNALKLALNSNSRRVPMSATKSQVGHPQGASGAAGLGRCPLCAMHTRRDPSNHQSRRTRSRLRFGLRPARSSRS